MIHQFRYFRAPDGRLMQLAGRRPPEGWEEITAEEYQQGLEAAEQAADQAAEQFHAPYQARRVEAARALLTLGLSPEHVAPLSGVPLVDLLPDGSPGEDDSPGGPIIGGGG